MLQRLALFLGTAMAIAAMQACIVWLAISTAGTVEPFDSDPTVIAMGRPSQRAPQPHP